MFLRKKLCPYCLETVQIKSTQNVDRTVTYSCPSCQSQIDPLYVKKYDSYPPVVLNVVGFRAHGKTVFLSALFYALRHFRLSRYWPEFSYLPVNHNSLQTIRTNTRALRLGSLPEPTQQVFPEPTMILADGLPFVRKGKALLLIYDAAGESFASPEDMISYAHFVQRASTVFFLVSLPRIRSQGHSDIADEMDSLLATYIQGMAKMNAPTKNQHLVVIFTAADELIPELPGNMEWEGFSSDTSIKAYIAKDALANTERVIPYFSEADTYAARMNVISEALERYTHDSLDAHNFVKLAKDHFQSVQFSMISALGFKPQSDGLLPVSIDSKRLLDPLMWVLHKASPGNSRKKIEKALRRLLPSPS